MTEHELHVPPGHYYSPIPNAEDFALANNNRGKMNLGGIELNELQQLSLAEQWLQIYPQTVNWLQHHTEKYSLNNTWFFGSDAISLSLMLISSPAKKVIEIGSGYSTALLEDLNKFWQNNQLSVLTIDPNPERVRSLNLNSEIIGSKVQKVQLEIFEQLQLGDVLLIDSSHILKAGSDVHYLFNEVIPHLASGVRIHVHDIFFPFEYPQSWLAAKIAFNELYALELLLRNSTKFKILYWNDYLEKTHHEWFRKHMPEALASEYETGGIWLEVL